MTGIHTLPAHLPPNDAKLFDVLHEWYGVGDFYDDEDSDTPWWRWRVAQISRVKSSRASRDASLPDLYVALLYCKAHNLPVEGVTWLYRHIAKAWRWWDRLEAVHHTEPSTAYADAIRMEAVNPDPSWLARLMRAAPTERDEVLAQWQAQWTV